VLGSFGRYRNGPGDPVGARFPVLLVETGNFIDFLHATAVLAAKTVRKIKLL
jgi:hypothetical protein